MLKPPPPPFATPPTFVAPPAPPPSPRPTRPEPRLVFAEVLGNPGLEVLDIPAVAKVAHDSGLPLMVDATFATPYLCRPLALGCDIVMHPTTKWLGVYGGRFAHRLARCGSLVAV